MLRSGKFKLIFKSVYIEIAHRVQLTHSMVSRTSQRVRHAMLSQPESPQEKPILDSEFINLRKVLPASYRPTIAQPALPLPLRADPGVIAGELEAIRARIVVEDGVNA